MTTRALTDRQNNFLKLWGETGFDKSRARDCALLSGYSDASSSNIVAQILGSASIRERVKIEMEKQGLTLGLLVKKHKRLLDAKDYNGNDDNQTQARVLKMGYDLHDAFPTKRLNVAKQTEERHMVDISVIRRAEALMGETLLPEDDLQEDYIEAEIDMEEPEYEPGCEPI